MSDAGEHQAAVAHKAVIEPLWTAPILRACKPVENVQGGSSVLVAEARCGYVPIEIVKDLPDDTRVIALDPSRAMLDQARQRVGEDIARRVYRALKTPSDDSPRTDPILAFHFQACLSQVVIVVELGRCQLRLRLHAFGVPLTDGITPLEADHH